MKQALAALLILVSASFDAAAVDCSVYTFNDLVACSASNTVANLKADIVLGPGQTLDVTGISNLTINGNDNGTKRAIDETSARFNTGPGGHYVHVKNSSWIAIRDVVFRSTPATDSACANPGALYNKPPCSAMVMVDNSTNVDIDRSKFLAAKTVQLQLFDSSSVRVMTSEFRGAATYGIAMSSHAGKLKTLQISNNIFVGAGANAVIAADVDSMWIGDNTFTDNHRLTQYSGFGGGQLLFEDSPRFDMRNVDVTGNTFKTTTVSTSHGIEFANFNQGKGLYDLRVLFNRIEGNQQSAITFDASDALSKVSGVDISSNEILYNRVYYKSQMVKSAFDKVSMGGNWIESVPAAVQASFDGTPLTCTLAPGASHCGVTVKWNVNLFRGGPLRITVRAVGTLIGNEFRGNFSSGIIGSGSQLADWIDSNGAVFELYYESDYANPDRGWAAPIASIVVKAVSAGQ